MSDGGQPGGGDCQTQFQWTRTEVGAFMRDTPVVSVEFPASAEISTEGGGARVHLRFSNRDQVTCDVTPQLYGSGSGEDPTIEEVVADVRDTSPESYVEVTSRFDLPGNAVAIATSEDPVPRDAYVVMQISQGIAAVNVGTGGTGTCSESRRVLFERAVNSLEAL